MTHTQVSQWSIVHGCKCILLYCTVPLTYILTVNFFLVSAPSSFSISNMNECELFPVGL